MDKCLNFAFLETKKALDLCEADNAPVELLLLKGKIFNAYHRLKNTVNTGDFLRYLHKFESKKHRDANAFKIFPDGVGKISILPITLSPSHHISEMLWETFFKFITEDSGWSNSPIALFSSTNVCYLLISLSHKSFE